MKNYLFKYFIEFSNEMFFFSIFYSHDIEIYQRQKNNRRFYNYTKVIVYCTKILCLFLLR